MSRRQVRTCAARMPEGQAAAALAPTAASGIGQTAMAAIRGQVVAEQAMRRLSRGAAGSDDLHAAHQSLKGDPQAERGFLGRVQKALVTGCMPGEFL